MVSTLDLDSRDMGSNPVSPAFYFTWAIGVVVITLGSEPRDVGSIPALPAIPSIR